MAWETDKPLSDGVTYPDGYTAEEDTQANLEAVTTDPVVIYKGQDHEIVNVVLVQTNDSVVIVDLETGDGKEV